MTSRLDHLRHRARQLRRAAAFPELAWKRLQIMADERWAGLVAPAAPRLARRLPTTLVIRVTERCFLRCKFCAQGGEHGRVDQRGLPRDFIPTPVLRRITAEAAGWRVKPLIKLTGGEPLLMREQLLDAVGEMRSRGLPVMLNTNGLLLQDERLARRLVATDLSCLSVSLDGSRDVHNELRGSATLFDAVLAGIANVRRARAAAGRRHPMILLAMVVSSENQGEIERVHRIAEAAGADWLSVHYLNFTTPESCREAQAVASARFGTTATPWEAFCNPRFTEVDPDLVAAQLERLMAARGSLPVHVAGGLTTAAAIRSYYRTAAPIRPGICHQPFSTMHVVTPGKAVFCIDYPFYEYGDVGEAGLEPAWFGERAARFRRELRARYRERGDNFPQCRRCNWMFT